MAPTSHQRLHATPTHQRAEEGGAPSTAFPLQKAGSLCGAGGGRTRTALAIPLAAAARSARCRAGRRIVSGHRVLSCEWGSGVPGESGVSAHRVGREAVCSATRRRTVARLVLERVIGGAQGSGANHSSPPGRTQHPISVDARSRRRADAEKMAPAMVRRVKVLEGWTSPRTPAPGRPFSASVRIGASASQLDLSDGCMARRRSCGCR